MEYVTLKLVSVNSIVTKVGTKGPELPQSGMFCHVGTGQHGLWKGWGSSSDPTESLRWKSSRDFKLSGGLKLYHALESSGCLVTHRRC